MEIADEAGNTRDQLAPRMLPDYPLYFLVPRAHFKSGPSQPPDREPRLLQRRQVELAFDIDETAVRDHLREIVG